MMNASEELGKLLAEQGHLCLNGGGRFGCMGGLNAGVLKNKGRAEGVIHEMFLGRTDVTKTDEGQAGLQRMDVATGPTLAERKRLLLNRADCFICLPGGPGTLDETFEVICERQLGLPLGVVPRPVCLLNVNGYWDSLMAQLRRAQKDGLLYKTAEEIVYCTESPADALKWCTTEVERLREMHHDVLPTAAEALETHSGARSGKSQYPEGVAHGMALALGVGIVAMMIPRMSSLRG